MIFPDRHPPEHPYDSLTRSVRRLTWIAVAALALSLVSLAVSIAKGQDSPRSELHAARLHAETLGQSALQARFISFYAVPAGKHDEYLTALRFAVNSVSRTALIVQPVQVTPTLYRLDATRLAPETSDWNAWLGAWESMVTDETYWHLTTQAIDPRTKAVKTVVTDSGAIDLKDAAALRAMTGSAGAIMRVDDFISRALDGPAYYRFVGIPEKLADYFKSHGLDDKQVRSLYAAHAANIQQRGPSPKSAPGRIARYPTPLGSGWITFDAIESPDKDPFRAPAFFVKADAHETIFTRPNGFHEFALWSGSGSRLDAADIKVAIDYEKPGELRTASSCLRCHYHDEHEGLRSFKHYAPRSAVIRFSTAKAAQEYGAVFDRQELLQREVARDREDLAEAVMIACGCSPNEAATAAVNVIDRYNDGRIDALTACRELGIPADPFLPVESLAAACGATTDEVALILLDGESVSRVQFQSCYAELALLAAAK